MDKKQVISDKIILGTVQLGVDYGINNLEGKPTQQVANDILEYAYQNNIQKLDTATAYGDAQKIIGEYQKKSKKLFSINTKLKGANKENVYSQIEESVKELHTKKIDSLFFHSFEEYKIQQKNSNEIINKYLEAKQNNLINSVGLSIYTNDELRETIEDINIDVIQIPFNLLDNSEEKMELLKEAKNKNKKIQVRSVFLQGLFFMNTEKLPSHLISMKPSIEAIHSIAKKYNYSISELALNYVLHQPLIDEVLIGVENLSQLQTNLSQISTSFELEIAKEIEEIIVLNSNLLSPANW